jgi:hypothetical protein
MALDENVHIEINRMARSLGESILPGSVTIFCSDGFAAKIIQINQSRWMWQKFNEELKWGASVPPSYLVCIYITMHEVA